MISKNVNHNYNKVSRIRHLLFLKDLTMPMLFNTYILKMDISQACMKTYGQFKELL